MFLKRFFEPKLAQTSYLIGCAATGEAHRHRSEPRRRSVPRGGGGRRRADHARHRDAHPRRLSCPAAASWRARTGATLYLSDEGDADWKYAFARRAATSSAIKHGDRITVGNVIARRPAHAGAHAGAPDVSRHRQRRRERADRGGDGRLHLRRRRRPAGSARARREHEGHDGGRRADAVSSSLQRVRRRGRTGCRSGRAHGAGSACGKGISAIPQSTLGYEQRFNWAFQAADEDDFVERVLAGQPEPPKYFAEMKRVNKRRAARPRRISAAAARCDCAALGRARRDGALVVDTRRRRRTPIGHVPGTINIPLNGSFTTWAGWLVPYTADVYLIVDGRDEAAQRSRHGRARSRDDRSRSRRRLFRRRASIDAWADGGPARSARFRRSTPAISRESLAHDGVTLVDVRSDDEWGGGHIPGARHIPLGYLADRLDECRATKPIVAAVPDRGRGRRSAPACCARAASIASSISRAASSAWIEAGTAGGHVGA